MNKYYKGIIKVIFIIWFLALLNNNSAFATSIPWEDALIIGYMLNDWKVDATELAAINAYRKPYADAAHAGEAWYNYNNHKLDYIIYDAYWNIYRHCNNSVDWTICITGVWCTPTTCEHITWTCAWTNCPVVNQRVNCKNTCIQKYICTSSSTQWSCPWGTTWSDESHDETKNLTQTWCEFACWTADWTEFLYNEVSFGSKTICKEWTANPSNPVFPAIWWKTSWTCSYESNSALCNAYRSNSPLVPVCGDWNLDSWEDCDDWNTNNTDFCPNNCLISWVPIFSYCWDWKINKPNTIWTFEECDDSNNLNYDGCSSLCKKEIDPPIIIKWWYCWDWEVQKPNSFWFNELCDDANTNSNDSCTNSCSSPTTWLPWEKWYCWNWKVEAPNSFWFNEGCDDWNTNNNDSCTNNCIAPSSWLPGGWIVIWIPNWISLETYSKCDLSGSWYANNVDTNTIYMSIKALEWIQWWKDVVNLWTPTDFKDLSNNYADRVNNLGWSSLSFTGIKILWNWNDAYMPIAKVSSVTPFVSCGNKVSFKLNGSTIILKDIWYNFKKPFVWNLTATNDNGTSWIWEISLWTKIKYKLSAIPRSTLNNYSIDLKSKNITYYWTWITLQDTTLIPYSWISFYNFYTRINSSRFAKTLNNNPWIQVIMPIINYSLSWKNVKYYLSEYDYANDKTPIIMRWTTFIWIKIIWWLQWQGKYEFTGQWENMSNLYPSDLRTEIRKRAFDYIKSMTSSGILNKVKYVEWNIRISWELPYETLVVKNWNVIIEWDLNTLNKKLWIIVLKDWYDVNTSYNDKWNVYVLPEVKRINAMIYADGGFISGHSSVWIPYIKDTMERTSALQNQLYMNGILFTRNTIWWGQYVGWYYTLPWWAKTEDFNKAMLYDLNYLRRWNSWCDDINLDWDCSDSSLWEYKEWFIIKYDSRIQTSPPKLFSK